VAIPVFYPPAVQFNAGMVQTIVRPKLSSRLVIQSLFTPAFWAITPVQSIFTSVQWIVTINQPSCSFNQSSR